MPTIADVRDYWNNNPLFSHELEEVGSPAFFEQLHAIKTSDVERYALSYWQFDAYAGRRVIDVGCGPGWITVQYAQHGALVDSVDLTSRGGGELTKTHLAYRGLSAAVHVGNAENLPFADETFDLVVSSGVLHHTPNTAKAFAECFRVLNPGGHAKITLYRKGLLHSPLIFGATRLVHARPRREAPRGGPVARCQGCRRFHSPVRWGGQSDRHRLLRRQVAYVVRRPVSPMCVTKSTSSRDVRTGRGIDSGVRA